MSELVSGKIVVQKSGALKVEFTNKKGKSVSMAVADKEPSAELTEMKKRKDKTISGLEVGLVESCGQPTQVRRKGGEWKEPVVEAPTRKGGERKGPESRKMPPPQLSRTFHNPYNFVPAIPRKTDDPDVGDHQPTGHDRYRPDLWSGRLTVRLTTETPLLIPDAARAEKTDNDHKKFPVRVGPDGKPYLSPTSVKGMLRSAYEAITNSRMGVFHGHEDRLAYRMVAQDGLKMVPARIENGEVVLLQGTSSMKEDGSPNGPMYAAWLSKYGSRRDWGGLDKHGKEVWAYVTPWHYRRKNRQGRVTEFDFWGVAVLRQGGGPQPSGVHSDSGASWRNAAPTGGAGRWVNGWVCITNRNIDNKHDERVFFVDGGQPRRIPLNDGLRKDWKELIKNYQEAHRREIAQGQNGPPALRNSVWSRHVTGGASEQELGNGTLCYAAMKDGQIAALYPVMISRRFFGVSPDDLLSAALKPARSIEQLSPADRVFGWVHQNGSGAWRGQVRVGPVECKTDDAIEEFEGDSVPLAILGEPKPQQARFYVAKDKSGTPQDDKAGKEAVAYSSGKGLRGRKVYPHHAGLPPEGYWANPLEDRTAQKVGGGFYQEYRRPRNGGAEQRDSQNRSILGWVKPKAWFTFDLHVTNLSAAEIGALIWLLRLPEKHFHRLGGGKPLGFGSARLELESIDLRDGEGWAGYYRALTAEAPNQGKSIRTVDATGGVIDSFRTAVSRAYGGGRSCEEVPFIKSFMRMAKGFAKPVHYPRSTEGPTPQGEAFKWFVENDKIENGQVVHGFALPNLANEEGLPILG